MKKSVLILSNTAFILSGLIIPLQFAKCDSGREILLAAEIGSAKWREENRQRELREIDRQNKALEKAARRAKEAETRKQWEEAQKKADDAARKKWEAEQRLKLPLEPIPK